ncbi:MAG: CRISPR-associated endoribonuclease Cas6 [Bacteroidetes bacterium 38_7]|nr:MAG: CRISPR-associated endoribonuclease Cas6 [Bacteroidetes bacterium 38_7]
MRFRIILNIDKRGGKDRLPINYQYECSAVIYKILSTSDSKFSEWLHENGFLADKKQFKLFTFSRLFIPQFHVEDSMLKIISDTMEWQISFVPDISTREFIQGIFKEQEFELGNKKAQIKCRVQSIEMLPPPEFKETMTFQTLSPLCLTLKRQDGTDEYVAPDHPMAKELIRQNLLDKYKAFTGNDFPNHDAAFDFKVTNQPRSSLVTIKADTPQESKIRAFGCNFQLTAPVELMKICYDCGIGSKNSLGFGMVETTKENNKQEN